MAVKVVHVSDITGVEGDEQSLGKLIVQEHPDYADLPVTLEALPGEVEALKGSSRSVTLEWIQPGAKRGERMTVSLEDFNLLGEAGQMDAAMEGAVVAKHRDTKGTRGTRGTRRRSRARVDYATLEHAGEPHRGRITEAEKEIVRNNLDVVNKRLREADLREIDPNDSTMKERYGL